MSSLVRCSDDGGEYGMHRRPIHHQLAVVQHGLVCLLSIAAPDHVLHNDQRLQEEIARPLLGGEETKKTREEAEESREETEERGES